ncbi:hypothetical protein TSUD_250000 [Trifolium subterraneum]|nr:hypothetical protein TSUD_250000 [Trifolium subterraneum]
MVLYIYNFHEVLQFSRVELETSLLLAVDKDINGDTGSKFILVDKSPEFSYEELANATDNFSLANKIGQGGFGEVYYGELKGQPGTQPQEMNFKFLLRRERTDDMVYQVANCSGCSKRPRIADFGLTKLTDIASSTDNTDHVAGTFGYMPPENAYGRISRKIDVYAFGVVLYELISAKAAVIKIDKTKLEFKSLEIQTNESIDEYKSLVALVIHC